MEQLPAAASQCQPAQAAASGWLASGLFTYPPIIVVVAQNQARLFVKMP